MQIEEKLVSGLSMIPETHLVATVMVYDSCPLIGTFQFRMDGPHILFWSADAPDGLPMRYAYVELTDEEAEALPEYFKLGCRQQPAYMNHPLLTNRRVVVGLSDEYWRLDRTAVIERSTSDVFAEIDRLFPVSH